MFPKHKKIVVSISTNERIDFCGHDVIKMAKLRPPIYTFNDPQYGAAYEELMM